jgi:hypothetical protein
MEIELFADVERARKFKQDTVSRNVAGDSRVVVEFIVCHFHGQGKGEPHRAPDFFQKVASAGLAHFFGRVRLGDLHHAISFSRSIFHCQCIQLLR